MYVIIKVLFTWSLSALVNDVQVLSPAGSLLSRILYWPSTMASSYHAVFYSCCLIILIATVVLPWNYVTSFLFFLICLNLVRLNPPIINGSAYVTYMLAFWCIGMSTYPSFHSKKLQVAHHALFALSVLFCQMQVAIIYFESGWDKLTSEVWRSGEAFMYLTHYDPLFNPAFSDLLKGKVTQLVMGWLTIGFELGFVVLVWFKRTRILVLCIGVIFHLVIIVMLTLPDFGVIMILSYLVFMKDSDYRRIPFVKRWF